ncbi:efflux RND transporter periplasmic adaptor subunit [Desulfobacterales bacterium HSG16]|nr:efflux RND transporter periplasmic adaptor subunit [Desulfobacterales bacterium HSG16]
MNRPFFMRIMKTSFALALFFFISSFTAAKEDLSKTSKKAPPPATPVVVADIVTGESEPKTQFVGTVYYSRVCKVASESEGLVTDTFYEEGETIKSDDKLVQLSTDLLDAAIIGTQASYEQTLIELTKAKKDYRRMNKLYKGKSISEVVFDDHLFKKKGLVKKVAALKASLDRMLLVKKKKRIDAPFSGIVIEKSVEKGEWVSAGGTVAVIADNSEVDVIIDVPGNTLPFLSKGCMLDVAFNGYKDQARFINVIPRGDIATRTFSIKLRLKNSYDLIEGMEARAYIPTGKKTSGLLVPRDSVIMKYGKNVVFTVSDSKARMIPVKITGYKNLMASIEGAGLSTGMQVIIKGNERVRNGQNVKIID